MDIDVITAEKTFPEPRLVIIGKGENSQGFIVAEKQILLGGGGWLQHFGGTDNFTCFLLRLLCKLP